MIDRETGTSWSQVTGRAVDGEHRGAQLVKLEAIQTTWRQWRTAHPDTMLLKKSEEVLGSHYQKYFDDPGRMGLFRARWLVDRMPGKTLVYGAAIGAHAVAVTDQAFVNDAPPRVRLGKDPVVFHRGGDGGVRAFVARLDGQEIVFEAESSMGLFEDAGGSTWDLSEGRCVSGERRGSRLESVATTPVYWFAWSSFYPNTQVLD